MEVASSNRTTNDQTNSHTTIERIITTQCSTAPPPRGHLQTCLQRPHALQTTAPHRGHLQISPQRPPTLQEYHTACTPPHASLHGHRLTLPTHHLAAQPCDQASKVLSALATSPHDDAPLLDPTHHGRAARHRLQARTQLPTQTRTQPHTVLSTSRRSATSPQSETSPNAHNPTHLPPAAQPPHPISS